MSTEEKVEDIVNTFDKNKIRCSQCGKWFTAMQKMANGDINATRWCAHCMETIDLIPASDLKLEKVHVDKNKYPNMKVLHGNA